jgi:hypothetical protein
MGRQRRRRAISCRFHPVWSKLKRPIERRRLSFGCYSLTQHDVRRAVAALELLAGAAWAWVIAAGLMPLVRELEGRLAADVGFKDVDA